VVNNSPKTVSGSAWTLGFRGGGGQIEVQGYGRVDIIDRGWSDQYQAWSVQVSLISPPFLYIIQPWSGTLSGGLLQWACAR
jgi:hypothetical protein